MSAMIDRTLVEQHLDALYGTADAGDISVLHLPSRATRSVPATDLEAAADVITRYGAAGNVYHAVGLQRDPLPPGKRGGAATVCGSPGLWIDVDVGTAGHAATNLPPDVPAALDLLSAAIPFSPTYIVGTGGGIHAYWLWREVWAFADDAERAQAAHLNKSLQHLVAAEAANRGWGVDATHDLARALRPPGTVNRKPGLPERPVTVLHPPGQRYAVEDLAAVLPLDLPGPAGGPLPKAARRATRAPAALWGRITAQCAFLRHCEDDAAVLSEPEWHAEMSVLGRCHDGEAIAHRVSQPYPRYDPAETARKIAYAQRADAPLRCATIRAERGGEPWCARCPHWGRIASPVQLGYPPRYRFVRAPADGRGHGNG